MDEKSTWSDWFFNALYFIVMMAVVIPIFGPGMLLDTLFGTAWVFVVSGLLILAGPIWWFFDRYTIRRRS